MGHIVINAVLVDRIGCPCLPKSIIENNKIGKICKKKKLYKLENSVSISVFHEVNGDRGEIERGR